VVKGGAQQTSILPNDRSNRNGACVVQRIENSRLSRVLAMSVRWLVLAIQLNNLYPSPVEIA